MTMRGDAYMGRGYSKGNRLIYTTKQWDTREQAIEACFAGSRIIVRVASGYGYNGTFDIRSITREEWERRSGDE